MAVEIGACIIGVFAIEGSEIKEYVLFKKDPREVAGKLKKYAEGGEFPELEDIKRKTGGKRGKKAEEFLKDNMRTMAVEMGFAKNWEELNRFIASVGTELAKMKMIRTEKRDKLIIQAVSALNDMDKILNTMSERLREWFGLHYPELSIKEHESFAKMVAKYGRRERFEEFEKSMGMELKEEDVVILQEYAQQLWKLYMLRDVMEKYLNRVVPEEMPNTNALLGSVLAARLLAHAGSLERMAKMPSSKLQLLGAEKALFRYMKERKKGKARPPRFGILFIHPAISGAKREIQGKIARLLASKLTIAVRADFYTKEDKSKELKEDFEKKLKEIRGEE
ncbi:MAG: NOP5/NOP56 family protein [Candidatus Aenigmatarchaeota archaeon]